MNSLQSKLNNTKGRFVTLNVSRAKTGVTKYCAKVQKVSEATVRFYDINAKVSRVAPLRNVSIA